MSVFTFEEREKNLKKLKRLRPIDDVFMRCIFRDNIPLMQHVIRVLTRNTRFKNYFCEYAI